MIIQGERVYLREVTADDATDRYCRWLNDPEVNRYLEVRFQAHTRESVRAYVESQQRATDSTLLAIVRKADDVHVGNLRIGSIDRMHQSAIIGIMIGEKAAWGTGLATDAIATATRHAFGHLGLRKLNARCYAANLGSIRAFEKAGWLREGVQRGQFIVNGEVMDGVWLGCLSEGAM